MEISTTSDISAFVRPCCIAFGLPVPAGYVESTSKLLDPARAHVVYDDGTLVAAAGAFAHSFTVPGGVVPAAAIFGIGVLPSHRRRGILSTLQKIQLSDAYHRGEPVAYLWSSEGPIYRRYGYGMASQTMRVTIETSHGGLRGPPSRLGSMRLVDSDEAYEKIAPIYDRSRKKYPGLFLRCENWWRLRRLNTPDLFHVVWGDRAYALYTVKMDTSSLVGHLEVVETVADSIEGEVQIWRYLLNMDLMRTVSASNLPIDHPLTLLLEDPLKVTTHLRSGIWVRIVDLQSALRGRALGPGSIVIEVSDTLLPHNQGTWRVSAEGVARVDSSSELVVDISDLGSVYLAGFSFADLARSGRVREQVPGSIRRADQVFSWHCKPWTPEIF